MADLRDFTGKNKTFTGVAGERISTGTTGERVNTTGVLRYNSTTNLMEYYNGSDWKPIDSPPVITSFAIDGGSNVTSGVVDNEGGGTVSIAVNGSLFDATGATVTFVGSGETISTTAITRNNANLLTCTFTEADFDISNGPYTLKVTNGSGLSAELADCITADQTTPVFNQAADTTVVLTNGGRGAGIPAADLCGASGSSNFSVTTGSLPSGLSMTTATGAITGTADAVGSDTTSTFTVTAVGDDATVTRQFKITVQAPVVTTFTSTGAGTFSATAGSTIEYIVVAGGGSGGRCSPDQDTGKGGGGRPSPGSGGSATQGSGTGYTGYGNAGGAGNSGSGNASGGGGGGAGGAGQAGQANPGIGGAGGVGRQSDISGTATYYAGGGGGGNNASTQGATRSAGGSGGDGRGNHGHQNNYGSQFPGVDATANTGGGGGGAMDGQGSNQNSGIGGAGGSGIIIVKA